jgi:hypothetical protein
MMAQQLVRHRLSGEGWVRVAAMAWRGEKGVTVTWMGEKGIPPCAGGLGGGDRASRGHIMIWTDPGVMMGAGRSH